MHGIYQLRIQSSRLSVEFEQICSGPFSLPFLFRDKSFVVGGVKEASDCRKLASATVGTPLGPADCCSRKKTTHSLYSLDFTLYFYHLLVII